MPDPITEAEIEIKLSWTADQRTTQTIERQADLMGFETANEYLIQLIAASIASNEADTIITDDGRILNGCVGYDAVRRPRNV